VSHGEAVKTISTCAALLLSTRLLLPAESTRDGLASFHKMQAALGGADRIASIRDFEQQVRATAWNGNTGQAMGSVTKRTRWLRPDLLRVDQVGPGSTYVLFFDGHKGWEVLPGAAAAVDLAGGELKFAQVYVRTFRLNVWLADRDPSWSIRSPSPGVVRVEDGDIAHQLDFTLDSASSLPSKTTNISLSDPANPVPSEEVVNEWETVEGVRFPRRWSVYRRGALVGEAVVETTRLNGGLRRTDMEAKPADLRPVLLPPAEGRRG